MKTNKYCARPNRVRNASSAIVLAAFVFALAGCASTSASADGFSDAASGIQNGPPPGSVTAQDTLDQWQPSVESFPKPLPSGVTWPSKPPKSLAENSLSEVGRAPVAAAFYWMCAWESEYLEAEDRGDAKAGALALDSLSSFGDLPIVKEHFRDVSAWTQDVVTRSRDGDSSILRESFSSGCSTFIGGE